MGPNIAGCRGRKYPVGKMWDVKRGEKNTLQNGLRAMLCLVGEFLLPIRHEWIPGSRMAVGGQGGDEDDPQLGPLIPVLQPRHEEPQEQGRAKDPLRQSLDGCGPRFRGNGHCGLPRYKPQSEWGGVKNAAGRVNLVCCHVKREYLGPLVTVSPSPTPLERGVVGIATEIGGNITKYNTVAQSPDI